MAVATNAENDLEIMGEREFYRTYGKSKQQFRQSSSMHHPQTEQAVENATDASSTRSNANEVADGNPNNQAPNNAGSNTDPDAGKPDTKQQANTAPKKFKAVGSHAAQKTTKLTNEQAQEKYKDIQRQKEVQAAFESRRGAREGRIQSMGRRGSVGAWGVLGAVVDGAMTYSSSREEDPNGSKIADMAKAGATAAGWLFAEPLMWGITIGQAGIGAGKMLYEDAEENYQKAKSQRLHISKDESGMNKGHLGGQMIDSEEAHTLRQRSEQVMRQHKIATESILGSEARQLHR